MVTSLRTLLRVSKYDSTTHPDETITGITIVDYARLIVCLVSTLHSLQMHLDPAYFDTSSDVRRFPQIQYHQYPFSQGLYRVLQRQCTQRPKPAIMGLHPVTTSPPYEYIPRS